MFCLSTECKGRVLGSPTLGAVQMCVFLFVAHRGRFSAGFQGRVNPRRCKDVEHFSFDSVFQSR